MAVYVVAITAVNGNRVSRPIVASCACQAIDIMRAAHDVSEHDQAFTIDVNERSDPDGAYEQLLKDATKRADDAEMWSRWDRR